MNLTVVVALVSAAAGAALAWQLQAHQIVRLELEQSNERMSIQRAARATLERNMSQNAAAQVAAANRGIRNRAAAGVASDVGNGLRLTTAATVRTVEADPSTCDSIIAAYSAVVDTSSKFIQAVSRDADQCHSDLTLTQEAWPK